MTDSPWKNASGAFLTQSLFLELGQYKPEEAVYTTKDEDHVISSKDPELDGKVYKSFKKLYLELEDPTEYLVATNLLGGWKHLQKLRKSPLVRDFLDECKAELEMKLRSRAVRSIANDSMSESKSAVASAKWMADKGWEPVQKRGPGRPSKAEKQAALKEELHLDAETKEELERMGLKH